MATGTTLAAQVRRLLVDTDDQAYSDADLLGYLNEGMTRFAAETHCNQALISKTVATNKVTYAELLTTLTPAVASKILMVGKVMYNDGTQYISLPKAPITETKSLLASTVSVPTRYSLFAETVFFDLDPSVSGLSNAFQIFASYVPVELTSLTAEVTIPVQWHPAIVKYVEFCCRSADRDAGLANGAFGQYEVMRARAAEHYTQEMEG